MVEFNEQDDGTVVVLGFSLSGDLIQAGSGSILSLTYQSNNIYTSEITISIMEELSYLGDVAGSPLSFTSDSGTITVLGEDPPPIQTVTNLVAVGGYGSVSLSWDDPNVVDITGYHNMEESASISSIYSQALKH